MAQSGSLGAGELVRRVRAHSIFIILLAVLSYPLICGGGGGGEYLGPLREGREVSATTLDYIFV